MDGRSADNSYANFRDTYTGIEAEVQSLKIRSNALPKYRIISAQLELLDKNIHNLEALHKMGFAASGGNPGPVLQHVKTQFETALTAMLALQNGLKREKVGKNQSNEAAF